MGMFSEKLAILDRNTLDCMIADRQNALSIIRKIKNAIKEQNFTFVEELLVAGEEFLSKEYITSTREFIVVYKEKERIEKILTEEEIDIRNEKALHERERSILNQNIDFVQKKKLKKLIEFLLHENRIEDLKKALNDEDYLDELYEEYDM